MLVKPVFEGVHSGSTHDDLRQGVPIIHDSRAEVISPYPGASLRLSHFQCVTSGSSYRGFSEEVSLVQPQPPIHQVVHGDCVAASSSMLQRRELERFEPLLISQMANFRHKSGRSALHPLNELLVRLVEGPPYLICVFKWGRTRVL